MRFSTEATRHATPRAGSGLGLAIVAGAVEKSGGTILARNSALSGLEIQIDFAARSLKHG